MSKSSGPMKQLTIQSLGFLIGFQEDIKVPRPLATINHTVISVSYRIPRRCQNPPAPWNNKSLLIIQSLGFLIELQKDVKILWHHETITVTIQSLGCLIRFQEDIKVPRPLGTINHTVSRVECQNHHHHHHDHHHHHHLGLPGRSLRVRANQDDSCRNIISYNIHI